MKGDTGETIVRPATCKRGGFHTAECQAAYDCDCHVKSAPDLSDWHLKADQTRFLLLHARAQDPPTKWRWHFGSTLLRAYTERGHSATITADSFADLVAAGMMKRSGCAGAVITDKGREQVA